MYSFFLVIVFAVFAVATVSLAVYGLHLYVLLALFLRRVKHRRIEQRAIIEAYHRGRGDDDYPVVTSQIPIYNEADVARRVIEAVAAIDYPAGRHEIQVLDDSTDQTRALIDRTASELVSQGVDVRVIRRDKRTAYKAGALAYGLTIARGRYIAVFDADFVPPADFLRKAVPLLEDDPGMACLQGRWDHLNRNESWLTNAQALGIDAHFAIEQGARAWNGLMMNFNGTAGVWAKAAIEDPAVGGWSGDTLTEDLDLSYRAQLAGWRLDYCLDMPCPAELPGSVDAFKSQQRRWATGSIQVARKLLPRIWAAEAKLSAKVEATLHLTHYSVSFWMLLLALAARPVLLVFVDDRFFPGWFTAAWIVVWLAAIAPSLAYAYARYSLGGGWSGIRTVPAMFVLGCGLCLNNSLAVVRGFFLRGGEFVRTPKSGADGSQARTSNYRVAQDNLWIAELVLGVYSFLSFAVYFRGDHRVFSFFLLMYGIGFTVIGWLSRPKQNRAGASASSETAGSGDPLPVAVAGSGSGTAS